MGTVPNRSEASNISLLVSTTRPQFRVASSTICVGGGGDMFKSRSTTVQSRQDLFHQRTGHYPKHGELLDDEELHVVMHAIRA
jgi:hypothetical protein